MRTTEQIVAMLRGRAHDAEDGEWLGDAGDMHAAADEIERLAKELATARDAVTSLFLSGDTLIRERCEAWAARDVAIAENTSLRRALQLLTYTPLGEMHAAQENESEELRAARRDAAARAETRREVLGETSWHDEAALRSA